MVVQRCGENIYGTWKMQYLRKILQWARPLFYFHWMHMFQPVSAGEGGVVGFEINQVSNTTAMQCIAPRFWPTAVDSALYMLWAACKLLAVKPDVHSWMNWKVLVSVWLRFLFGFASARMNKLLPSRVIESGPRARKKALLLPTVGWELCQKLWQKQVYNMWVLLLLYPLYF